MKNDVDIAASPKPFKPTPHHCCFSKTPQTTPPILDQLLYQLHTIDAATPSPIFVASPKPRNKTDLDLLIQQLLQIGAAAKSVLGLG